MLQANLATTAGIAPEHTQSSAVCETTHTVRYCRPETKVEMFSTVKSCGVS